MRSGRSKWLVGLLVLCLSEPGLLSAPPNRATKPAPVIVVEASYPGADAQSVADTVAAPIEFDVTGIEYLLRMTSRSTSDGKYALELEFEPGTDFNTALVLVQNRVAVTNPRLPAPVQKGGVTCKKKGPLLLLVGFTSPDGRFDTLYLSNYATLRITDELKRFKGVGDVALHGQREVGVRVWIDPQKLAARNLTAADVVGALARQNLRVANEPAGDPTDPKVKQFRLTVTAQGRLTDTDEFEGLILKTKELELDPKAAKADPAGPNDTPKASAIVRLRDVARVELASSTDNCASFNGKPGVALGVHPTGEVRSEDVSRTIAAALARLRPDLPDGLDLQVVFDFTPNLQAPESAKAPEYLLIDVQLPDAASPERTQKSLLECDKLLRGVRGVRDVLAFSANPFDTFSGGPCLLVRLVGADQRKNTRHEMVWAVRARLEQVQEAVVRVRELGRDPSCAYPIELAVTGPDAGKVRELTDRLGERMRKSKKLLDVWVNPASRPRPQLVLEIDHTKAATLGVGLTDLYNTLQTYTGSTYINDFNRFGRTVQITLAHDADPKRVEDLKNLQVRNKEGKMVKLSTLLTVRTVDGAAAIERIDEQSAIRVSANPVVALSVEKARALCETEFGEARRALHLPTAYRLIWLPAGPKSK
jgi:multidrug efflux pump subunit AcrB